MAISNVSEAESSTRTAGICAFADQAVVSFGNFLTNVFLARTLPPNEYGIFVLLYGMLVLLNSYHSSAIIYPLSLSGAPSASGELRRFIGLSLNSTALLLLPSGLIIFTATILLHRVALAPIVIAALFCWQVQETLRRGLMTHLLHRKAIWGDALSYLGQAVFIGLYVLAGYRSLEIVFGILCATSLLGASIQRAQLKLPITWHAGQFEYLRSSWSVSRWAVLANTAVVIPGFVYPWLMAVFGTQLAASYQALVNILGVSNPIMMSLGNVALPVAVRANSEGGFNSARRAVFRYGMVGAAIIIPCYLALFRFPRTVLELFYGAHSPYLSLTLPLRVLIVAYALSFVAYLFGVFFYAQGRSLSVFRAQAMGAFLAIASVPLVIRFLVLGASYGLVLAYGTQVLVFLYLMNFDQTEAIRSIQFSL